jgi:hypothetical protein
MQRLILTGSKSILKNQINKALNQANPGKLLSLFSDLKKINFIELFLLACLLTTNVPAPPDNRIEVFVDDKPVLVPPGSTALQVDWTDLF